MEWLEARAGVVTGTGLKRVMGRTYKDYIYELIADSLAPVQEAYTNDLMERGHVMEDAAIEEYEARTGEVTEVVGFCLHSEHDWLGLSPDRLVRRGGKYVKGVEVKSPKSKAHIKYLASDTVSSDYKYQVLHYFIICPDLEEVDFITYDPRIVIEELRLKVITVKREDVAEEIEEVFEKLNKFRVEWEHINSQLVF